MLTCSDLSPVPLAYIDYHSSIHLFSTFCISSSFTAHLSPNSFSLHACPSLPLLTFHFTFFTLISLSILLLIYTSISSVPFPLCNSPFLLFPFTSTHFLPSPLFTSPSSRYIPYHYSINLSCTSSIPFSYTVRLFSISSSLHTCPFLCSPLLSSLFTLQPYSS